ncbi:hypothetical protein Rsub_12764 [Raphidocelis subcapitata]|uniref:Uncharacterized protein n=1 Tax=Raphidocelis subcapitata TaxID=307507 RepID=A0A2V0PPE1_9CHLO|nr:hypothetical protein Rsub_12764 [Raphidocelis subcapitata]|eukprot:GBG00034.1 hypothetical protein Rsub_12764 [Raphidocelis subcapitata]
MDGPWQMRATTTEQDYASKGRRSKAARPAGRPTWRLGRRSRPGCRCRGGSPQRGRTSALAGRWHRRGHCGRGPVSARAKAARGPRCRGVGQGGAGGRVAAGQQKNEPCSRRCVAAAWSVSKHKF